MQLWTIQRLHENSGWIKGLPHSRALPCNRQQMTRARRLGGFFLAVAARQADGSHLPDVGFFRYFILADSKRACDDWTAASIARISREVQILLCHGGSFNEELQARC